MRVGQIIQYVQQFNSEAITTTEDVEFDREIDQIFNKINFSNSSRKKVLTAVVQELDQTKEIDISISKFQHLIELAEKEFCAIKIQSSFRMLKVKSTIIYPKELIPYIERDLGIKSALEIKKLAYVIFLESIKLLSNPDDFQGGGIRVSKAEFSIPKAMWIRLCDCKEYLHIQFYGNLFASGTYKNVKKSTYFKIALLPDKPREIRSHDNVLVRSKNEVLKNKKSNMSHQQIQRKAKKKFDAVIEGVELMKMLLQCDDIRNDKKFRVAGIPKIIRSYQGKFHPRLEWEDKYANSNIHLAIDDKLIQVGTQDKRSVKISIWEKMRIIEQVIYTTTIMHKNGFVHRDIKPSNILLYYDEMRKRSMVF